MINNSSEIFGKTTVYSGLVEEYSDRSNSCSRELERSEFHQRISNLYQQYRIERGDLVALSEVQTLISNVSSDVLLQGNPSWHNKTIFYFFVYIENDPRQLFYELIDFLLQSDSLSKVIDAILTPTTVDPQNTLLCYIIMKEREPYLDYLLKWISTVSDAVESPRLNNLLESTLDYIEANQATFTVKYQSFLCQQIVTHFRNANSSYQGAINKATATLERRERLTEKRLDEISVSKKRPVHSPKEKKITVGRLFKPDFLAPIDNNNLSLFDISFQKLTVEAYYHKTAVLIGGQAAPRKFEKLSAGGKTQAGMWAEALVFKNMLFRMVEKYGKHFTSSQKKALANQLKENRDVTLELIHPKKGFFTLELFWPNQRYYQRAYSAMERQESAHVSTNPFDIRIRKEFPYKYQTIKNIEVKSSRVAETAYQRSKIRFSKDEIRVMRNLDEKYRFYFVTGTESKKEQVRIYAIPNIENIVLVDNKATISKIKIRL